MSYSFTQKPKLSQCSLIKGLSLYFMCSDQHIKYWIPRGFPLTSSLLLDYYIKQYLHTSESTSTKRTNKTNRTSPVLIHSYLIVPAVSKHGFHRIFSPPTSVRGGRATNLKYFNNLVSFSPYKQAYGVE